MNILCLTTRPLNLVVIAFVLWGLLQHAQVTRCLIHLKRMLLSLRLKYLSRDEPRMRLRKIDVFKLKVQEQGLHVSPDEMIKLFPRHFERIGRVVIVKLNPGIPRDAFAPCAGAFAETFSPLVIDVVLLDSRGIVGELREPQLDVLWKKDISLFAGQKLQRDVKNLIAGSPGFTSNDVTILESCTKSLTFTTHIENGVRYSLDVCKVMFCSGNGTERMHFAALKAKDEVVVDMFAGIGYFTLPLAMKGGVKVVHALEKNKHSALFLIFNAVQNKVNGLISVHCGDNRVVGSELCGCCDRVIMGYIPSCENFLPRAVSFLRQSPCGAPVGTVHYHFLAPRKYAPELIMEHLRLSLGGATASSAQIGSVRVVKSYAPRRFHCVADLVFSGVR
uniref:SAM-dependent methyltransferase TRM5/TYW2-type domain-containing protein n=1 Tax=Trypanosoma congolense (strain IL3000) TaxID=1068625 RepID=G0UVS7_TRYCI|nr:conserved hypothetical protein [Trypanosoma congolense IL3000]